MPDQTFPKRSAYPASTKKILAIMLPIAGVVVLSGVGALIFIFYKKFRQEQYRVRKPAGAMRLQENYSSNYFTKKSFQGRTSMSFSSSSLL